MSSPAGPVVRPATEADAAAIAAVHVAGWQAAYAAQLPDDYLRGLSVANRERGWRRSITATDRPGRIFVAVVPGVDRQAVADGRAGPARSPGTEQGDGGGVVVGFVAVGPSRDADAEGTAELQAIYVHPRRWRGGLGGLLHDHALACLRAAGYRRATLWVLRGNDSACRFYERYGWAPDGATKVEALGDTGIQLTEIRYARPLA